MPYELGGGGGGGDGGEGGFYLKGLIFGFYGISSDCYTVRGVLVLPVLKTRYIHTVNVLIYLKATLIGALKVCNKFLRTLKPLTQNCSKCCQALYSVAF